MMKKISALLIAVLAALTAFVPAFAAENVTAAAVNASGAEVVLTGADRSSVENILYITVSLSGCAELTDADLKFVYDPEVLSFLGGRLLGAAAGDSDLVAAFTDGESSDAAGQVGLSFYHLDKLSVEEGNGDFCELAFRTGSGKTVIKAAAANFEINESPVKVSLGKYKYSAGAGNFFRQYGSMILIIAVAAVIVIVLAVLLVIIHNLKKKNIEISTELFEANSAAGEDATAEEAAKAPETEEETNDEENK